MYPVYSYQLSSTLNSEVDIERLEKEIIYSEAYGFGVFNVVYDGIIQINNEIKVSFKNSLTTEEKDILDLIIGQHSGKPLRPPALVELDALQESDKRIAVVSTPVEHGWASWMTGASDDLDDKIRGGGDPFVLEFDGEGLKTVEVKFFEPVQIHIGEIVWGGSWSYEDMFDVGVYISGNKIGGSLSLAQNDGNVDSIPYLADSNILVPNQSNTGQYNIDLSKASPAYAYDKGHWDVDILTGSISPAINGDGGWNLLTNDILPYFARRVSMGHSSKSKMIESHKTKLLHPTHNLQLTVQKNSSGSGWVQAVLHAFRVNTA